MQAFVDGFDFSVIQAFYSRQHGVPHVLANQTKREFCRFLVLKALENDLEARLLSPSGVVDAF